MDLMIIVSLIGLMTVLVIIFYGIDAYYDHAFMRALDAPEGTGGQTVIILPDEDDDDEWFEKALGRIR